MTSGDARKEFFVSYTAADERWACWVAYELEEAGYSVVIQKWDFRPGSDFVAEMDAALTVCDRTIAILSADYLAAAFTKPEWRAAFATDPDGAARKLIPVRVGDARPHGLLRTRIWIDLVNVDEDMARENDEKTSSVHFLRFELNAPVIAAMHVGSPLAVGVDHPLYSAVIDDVDTAIRQSLANDLQH